MLKIRLNTKAIRPHSNDVEPNTMFEKVHADMLSERTFKQKKIVCQQTVVKSKHSSCALTLLHGLTFSFLRANSSPGFKLALRPFFPSLLLRFLQIHRLHIQ